MKEATSRVDDITGQLRDDILRGQYRPGERLPSERDLAARFEVNRGAVREAVKKLEQLGIASVQPGGARVVAIEDATLEVLGHIMDLQELPNATLVSQLLEVTGAMMSISAASAVARADENELAAIKNLVDQLIQEQDAEKVSQGWRELGDLFLKINQNLVMKLIQNGLKTQFMGRLSHVGVRPQRDRSGDVELLKCMQKAIVNRDTKTVRESIVQHFDRVRQSLENALDKKSNKDDSPHVSTQIGVLS